MFPTATEPGPALDVDPRAVRRKVARRLLPLIFIVYIISYLDRVNVGFAKDRMQASLGFSDRAFGWASGIFFAGYLLLEIPGACWSNHEAPGSGSRAILVTWGVCSMAVALVRTGWQFTGVRFLLGLAESGFFPGVIVYLTHWFPRAERGKAMAGLVLAVPVSLALGAQGLRLAAATALAGTGGVAMGLPGRGAPGRGHGPGPPMAVDRPAHAGAGWRREREWLEKTLDAERQEVSGHGVGLGRTLQSPAVWLLALGILASNIGGYAAAFWLPTAVKGLLLATGKKADPTEVLNWLGSLSCSGWRGSGSRGGRRTGSATGSGTAASARCWPALCLAASVAPGQSWSAVFAWLCIFEFFAFFWPSPFWVLPTLTLSASEAAVAIGFINICATSPACSARPRSVR